MIDLLDGIINFVKCLLYFCVFIVVCENGCIMVGVVYDFICNEFFIGVCGEGVKLNEFCLCVDISCCDLNGIVFVIGFLFKNLKYCFVYLNMFEGLMNNGVVDFCCIGLVVLDLVYVVVNCVDGFFEIGLKFWDCVVGELIVCEVGVIVINFVGGIDYLKLGNFVVG